MRSRAPRSVTQSFKKVINYAPASQPAATKLDYPLTTGTDSVAAGQTGASDTQVPTGSILKEITIQVSSQNLVNVAAFQWITIQRLHAGQTSVDPQAIGGSNQRNQVHLQLQLSMGQNQNQDRNISFKIPKKFSRVREGDVWQLVTKCDQIHTQCVQAIYKFYR